MWELFNTSPKKKRSGEEQNGYLPSQVLDDNRLKMAIIFFFPRRFGVKESTRHRQKKVVSDDKCYLRRDRKRQVKSASANKQQQQQLGR